MSRLPIDIGVLDPATSSSTGAIVSDEAFVAAITAVEEALVDALRSVAGAPSRPAGTDLDAAFEVPDAGAVAAGGRAGGNPVIPVLAALRSQAQPQVLPLLHLGATSQDVLDTAIMLVAKRSRTAITARIADVAGPLATLANRHRATPMAGRTLGQHAAPTTFGLRVSVLLDGVVRAFDHLAALELPAQLGGSVGTLAVLVDALGTEAAARVRPAFAERLGLAHHDGVWHVERSPIGELGAALAVYIGALGRIGLEIAQLCRTEIGELVVVAAADQGVSSAMPQKRNPVAAVLLVSNARRAPGLASTLLGAQLAIDDRPAGDWHAEWQPLRELLRLAIESTALAADAVAAIRVVPDRMLANLRLSGGALHAERAQGALVPVVGRARAAALVAEALAGDDFVPALLTAIGDEPGVDPAALDRVRAVTGIGGPVGLSEPLIDAAIAAARRLW